MILEKLTFLFTNNLCPKYFTIKIISTNFLSCCHWKVKGFLNYNTYDELWGGTTEPNFTDKVR